MNGVIYLSIYLYIYIYNLFVNIFLYINIPLRKINKSQRKMGSQLPIEMMVINIFFKS